MSEEYLRSEIPEDVAFTLSCVECDVDSPDSYELAVAQGWTWIRFSPEGLSENFVGLCPVCRWHEEQQAAIPQDRPSFYDDGGKGGDPCPT